MMPHLTATLTFRAESNTNVWAESPGCFAKDDRKGQRSRSGKGAMRQDSKWALDEGHLKIQQNPLVKTVHCLQSELHWTKLTTALIT